MDFGSACCVRNQKNNNNTAFGRIHLFNWARSLPSFITECKFMQMVCHIVKLLKGFCLCRGPCEGIRTCSSLSSPLYYRLCLHCRNLHFIFYLSPAADCILSASGQSYRRLKSSTRTHSCTRSRQFLGFLQNLKIKKGGNVIKLG